MKRLIVVVDMQNDFVSGALGSLEARAIVPVVKELLSCEREGGSFVVFTQDTHGEDYLDTQEGKLLPVLHCVKGTQGWEIVPELASSARNAKIFEKGTFGSVSLAEYVKEQGFGDVVLCGVCTDICVVSNALLIKAFNPETTVRVQAKACAGTSLGNHEAALSTMRSCQIIVE